jgi:hypothetical protein
MKTLLILSLLTLSLCGNASKIKNYLRSHKFTSAGAAGLMGNLEAESGLRPDVYEYSKQKIIGLSQADYIRKTNDGSYKNFIRDGAGFGLAQWTYWSRKEALLNACRGKIADLNCQLSFLVSELRHSFSKVYHTLTSSHNVDDCCDIVLLKFERPYNARGQIGKRRALCRKYQ